MLRLVVTAVLAGTAALAVPASADPLPDVRVPGRPHYWVHAEDGRVSFGTSVPGQPLVGGWVDANTGSACAGFSLQRPVCTDELAGPVRELIDVNGG